MSIEQIFSDKTEDQKYDIKDIKEVGKQIKDEYSEKTGDLKTDIKDKLDVLRDNIELKAIQEANEKTWKLPNNQKKIQDIQNKIKQIETGYSSTENVSTITKALQIISGSDNTLQKIVNKEIRQNVLFFKRTGEKDREVLKGLCKECTSDAFSKETLKAVCYLQAMSQDYFNPDYGVDGVVGGNTLRAIDEALKLMLPKTEKEDKNNSDQTKELEEKLKELEKKGPRINNNADDKKLTEEEQKGTKEIIELKKKKDKETDPIKKQELEKEIKTKQEEVQKIVKKIEAANTAKSSKENKEIKETANLDVETPEILKLKKDISEHFTLNGKKIGRETDISNTISKKDGKYTIAIDGYTNIQFSYRIDKELDGKEEEVIVLEGSKGGVTKGLLKYDVAMQTTEIKNPEDKEDIKTMLNQEVSQKALNEQFKRNNPDYEVKNSTDISEEKITLKYKPSFIKDKTDEKKPIEDEITIDLTKKNEQVLSDGQGDGKFNQWQKKEGKIIKDQDFAIDTQYHLQGGVTKVIHYAQSKVEDGETKLNIINNVQEGKGNSFVSVYPEHTEMTDPDLNKIKADFENNKVEKIFDGKNEKHKEDFQKNWKIIKDSKGGYELDITFVTNHGKEQVLKIPFTKLVDAKNTNQYTLTPPAETIVDGIVYDIVVPKEANKTPDIKMLADDNKTLKLAEEKTRIAIESNIFTGINKDRGNDVPNTYNIQLLKFTTGNISFDGKGGYKKELLLGEKKEGNNIIIPGKKVGELYFDQDYKLIHVDILKEGKPGEIDFIKPENIGIENIQEEMQGKKKGILLKPEIKDRKLSLNFETPKTPEEREKNRETPAKYEERLREERQTLFEGLKKFSTSLRSKQFLLPPLTAKNEKEYTTSKIKGPDANGVYLYKIANADTKNAEQILYFQIEKENIILSNSDGKKTLDKAYLRDNLNKDIYEIKTNGSNITPRLIDKAEKDKIPEINSDSIRYKSDKVDINILEDNIRLLSGGTGSFTYGANGKEMLTVYLDQDKKLDITQYKTDSKVLIPNAINNPERILFGSYENFFAGEGRNEMGITEQQYEDAFTTIYNAEASKDTGKTIAQVKVCSKDGKYYYDYMQISQSGNEIKLRKLDGIEKTKEIMKERLNTLVQVNKLELSPTKGDQLRGTKLNNQDTTNKMIYLKTGEAEIKLSLTANDGSKTNEAPKLKIKNDSISLSKEEISLGAQKIKCSLKKKDNRYSIKLDLQEQKAEKTNGGTETSSNTTENQPNQTTTPPNTAPQTPEQIKDRLQKFLAAGYSTQENPKEITIKRDNLETDLQDGMKDPNLMEIQNKDQNSQETLEQKISKLFPGKTVTIEVDKFDDKTDQTGKTYKRIARKITVPLQ